MNKHRGRTVAKCRNFKGIKQDSLAQDLNVSQSEMSRIENLEDIDDNLFAQIAEALGVSPEFLDNFDENSALYHISNNIDNTTITENSNGISQVFNPLDKVIELYERLLASEREKIELFKKNKPEQ
ncbi:helix-turn-helix transcriptional regulator [Algoriphagus sp. AGSA1]|uniref:helix-turn-helix domain-containing protein n=1 Tax=unclassified Algoriphagus TaxID=2641541 RepID=UPI001781D675|nr:MULTISPECIES: helix-turn-helix transcriptional regulator [unclassified Algoriphagus]MCE7057582.1 helix-turn-helix transcriptional regulator [Algoriphagus sp. AGSA1]